MRGTNKKRGVRRKAVEGMRYSDRCMSKCKKEGRGAVSSQHEVFAVPCIKDSIGVKKLEWKWMISVNHDAIPEATDPEIYIGNRSCFLYLGPRFTKSVKYPSFYFFYDKMTVGEVNGDRVYTLMAPRIERIGLVPCDDKKAVENMARYRRLSKRRLKDVEELSGVRLASWYDLFLVVPTCGVLESALYEESPFVKSFQLMFETRLM